MEMPVASPNYLPDSRRAWQRFLAQRDAAGNCQRADGDVVDDDLRLAVGLPGAEAWPTLRVLEPFGRILPVPVLGALHHQYISI